MHPLLLLLPATICAGLAIVVTLTMAMDIDAGVTHVRSGEIAASAAIVLASAAAAAICVAWVLL
jgi:hypothetical protein